MMKLMKVFLVAGAMLFMAQSAVAETVYENDFGAIGQLPDPVYEWYDASEWQYPGGVVNGTGGWDVFEVLTDLGTTQINWGMNYREPAGTDNWVCVDPYGSPDFDGDGMSGKLITQGTYALSFIKHITLPAGYTMTNLELTVWGYGHASYNTQFGGFLSHDGVVREYNELLNGAAIVGQSAPWTRDLQTHSIPFLDGNYEGINDVYVGINLYNGNNISHDNYAYAACVRGVMLTADVTVPEPMTMILLALGGVGVLRRRR